MLALFFSLIFFVLLTVIFLSKTLRVVLYPVKYSDKYVKIIQFN